jgi:hypothetical protein
MSILGCSRHPEKPSVSGLGSSKFLFYLILAVSVLVVIALAVYHSQSRRRYQEDLKKRLIEQDKIWKLAEKGDSDNCMYIIDDLPWNSTSPDDFTPHPIHPVNTKSIFSTSRFSEEKELPHGEGSPLGERKLSESSEDELLGPFVFPSLPIRQTTSVLEIVDTMLKSEEDTVSPISSPGGSVFETNEIFDDDTDLTHCSEKRSEDDGD